MLNSCTAHSLLSEQTDALFNLPEEADRELSEIQVRRGERWIWSAQSELDEENFILPPPTRESGGSHK